MARTKRNHGKSGFSGSAPRKFASKSWQSTSGASPQSQGLLATPLGRGLGGHQPPRISSNFPKFPPGEASRQFAHPVAGHMHQPDSGAGPSRLLSKDPEGAKDSNKGREISILGCAAQHAGELEAGGLPQGTKTGSGQGRIAVVDSENMTPEQFWDEFVSKRVPVVIRGYPQDPSWRAGQLWSLEYLSKKAVRLLSVPLYECKIAGTRQVRT